MKRPAIIVDMDGTLSDCAHRRHFIEGKKQNYASFYRRCGDDPLHEHIALIVRRMAQD